MIRSVLLSFLFAAVSTQAFALMAPIPFRLVFAYIWFAVFAYLWDSNRYVEQIQSAMPELLVRGDHYPSWLLRELREQGNRVAAEGDAPPEGSVLRLDTVAQDKSNQATSQPDLRVLRGGNGNAGRSCGEDKNRGRSVGF